MSTWAMQRRTHRKLVRTPDRPRTPRPDVDTVPGVDPSGRDRFEGSRAAIRAWRTYRAAPLRVRLFLLARLAVLPRRPLAQEFAQLEGRVLGVGSGHGLVARWLAELNPNVTVTGVDLAADRVAIAQATEARSPRVRIRVQDVRTLDEDGAYDAAAAIDLVHHVPPADRAALAKALARAIRPG